MKNYLFLATTICLFTLTGCGSDDEDEPEYVYPNISLEYDETYQIEGVTTGWISENEEIASVSSTGLVTGGCEGSTIITNGDNKFTVESKPTVTLYPNPYLEWGESYNPVMYYMREYTDYTLQNEILTYKDYGKALYITYNFEEEKLSSVGCIVPIYNVTPEEMANHLTQRYIIATVIEDSYMFVSPDRETVVMFQMKTIIDDLVCYIYYTQYPSDTSRSISEYDISLYNTIKEKANAFMDNNFKMN